LETILVVDDEPTVLNLCRRILQLGGYSVVSANNGNDALRVLQSNPNPIDLALLDVMMPGMNGIELATRIQGSKPEIPVVLMSGFGPQEIARVAGDIKSYRIIWKPFKTESLLRMIENAMGGTSAPAESEQ
jgi:two-component system cell cycle sensor histidine kinase/response regulator CckA